MEDKLSKASAETREAYKEILELIGHDEEACKFMDLYAQYIHLVDDVIDVEKKDPELILKAFNMSTLVFSTPFWLKYSQQLLVVDVLINNQYADSVEWESSGDKWKRRDARCLSHCGYNMFFAVVLLVAGREGLRKISAKFRQWSHIKHLNDSEFKSELE